MSSPASEVDWQMLRDITGHWTGSGDDLAAVCPLLGGCINITLKLTTRGGDHAVLKITPHRIDRHYESEAFHLDHLRSLGLPTPKVLRQHTGTLEEPFSYLLMEFIPGVDLDQAIRQCDSHSFNALQRELGEMIATLHTTTADKYGHLGEAKPPTFSHWSTFFREVFDPVWLAADQCGLLSKKERKLAARVHDRLDRLLVHADRPRLVHWDIWASNVLVKPAGESDQWQIAAILDPGCRFAHAEAELAYVELFKTGNRAFFDAYHHTHRSCDGYHSVRKHVYQLYFLLNHLQLFGRPYHRRTAETLERLASMV
jgi:fructosamine-3-kinase